MGVTKKETIVLMTEFTKLSTSDLDYLIKTLSVATSIQNKTKRELIEIAAQKKFASAHGVISAPD